MRHLGKAFHILSNDPALRRPPKDAPPEDVAAFEALLAAARASGDRSALPLATSRKPVLWRLRGLSLHAWEEVSAEGNTSRMCRRAVQYGLAGFDDAVGTDGEKLTPETESDGVEKILTYDVTEEIYGTYLREAIVELGVRIMELSNLRPQSGQG